MFAIASNVFFAVFDEKTGDCKGVGSCPMEAVEGQAKAKGEIVIVLNKLKAHDAIKLHKGQVIDVTPASAHLIEEGYIVPPFTPPPEYEDTEPDLRRQAVVLADKRLKEKKGLVPTDEIIEEADRLLKRFKKGIRYGEK